MRIVLSQFITNTDSAVRDTRGTFEQVVINRMVNETRV